MIMYGIGFLNFHSAKSNKSPAQFEQRDTKEIEKSKEEKERDEIHAQLEDMAKKAEVKVLAKKASLLKEAQEEYKKDYAFIP